MATDMSTGMANNIAGSRNPLAGAQVNFVRWCSVELEPIYVAEGGCAARRGLEHYVQVMNAARPGHGYGRSRLPGLKTPRGWNGDRSHQRARLAVQSKLERSAAI